MVFLCRGSDCRHRGARSLNLRGEIKLKRKNGEKKLSHRPPHRLTPTQGEKRKKASTSFSEKQGAGEGGCGTKYLPWTKTGVESKVEIDQATGSLSSRLIRGERGVSRRTWTSDEEIGEG